MSELHERSYKAELRERRDDGTWSVEATHRGVGLAFLMDEYPSRAWAVASSRIAELNRGDHTRIELGDGSALMLERV